jgi:putative oxidoreductase
MLRSLGNYIDSVPLVLRVGLGATQLFAHGLPKLFNPEGWERTGQAMASLGIGFAPVFWGFMAGAMETLCGLLLIVGLWVRPSCVVLLWIMFVAAAQNVVTAGSLAGGRAHPIDAGVGLLALLILGAGAYSLDRKFGWDAAPVGKPVARKEGRAATV